MGHPNTAINETPEFRVLRELRHWRVAASYRGALWIQPTMTELSFERFAMFVKRLRPLCRGCCIKRVVFDLGATSMKDRDWTRMIALLAAFARRMSAGLRPMLDGPAAEEFLRREQMAGFVHAQDNRPERAGEPCWFVLELPQAESSTRDEE